MNQIIAVCAPHPRKDVGTRCESDRAAFIVRSDQTHLVTCPWCLGARTNAEARKIVDRLYANPPPEPPRGRVLRPVPGEPGKFVEVFDRGERIGAYKRWSGWGIRR